MPLGDHRWGKSDVRVSKVFRGDERDDFVDLRVQVLLRGDVAAAHTDGDNSGVVPTDTMRNTVHGLAQEHLTRDLERFGEVLCGHFLGKPSVEQAAVTIRETAWTRASDNGFVAGGSERRTARVVRGVDEVTSAGVEELSVLKTGDSAFEGFPRDQFTTLPEASDRVLATSINAGWDYLAMPDDTSATWAEVRRVLVERFLDDWSASIQHQGYMMGEAVLAAVDEIGEIRLGLPNLHHLPVDLTRFGMDWEGTVFQPVSEPYGDIALTVTRS